MTLWDRFVIIFCKGIGVFIRLLNLGSGGTWPGEIALRIDPKILESFRRRIGTVIVVVGTNGKTTTVKMLETILSKSGKIVRRNDSGANLDNGIISCFISNTSWTGKMQSDYFIFEVDEATFPAVLPTLLPDTIILLNLFRDQLDRYGEVDVIADKWLEALSHLDSEDQDDTSYHSTVIINADDPQLVYIGSKLKTKKYYFGLDNKNLYLKNIQHATDSIYCQNCGSRLVFEGVYFSHLGTWSCPNCDLAYPDLTVRSSDFASPLEGVYNKYNTLAAASAAKTLGISDAMIKNSLKTFQPAFGRLEEVNYLGKRVKILLSKNPTGLNESLRTVLDSVTKDPILIVLNDRIPDGTDVSWIWDADFEMLSQHAHKIFLSGERVYDLALRLKYAGLNNTFDILPNLEDAVASGVNKTENNETLWILPTYSAMLEVRKIVTGKSIL